MTHSATILLVEDDQSMLEGMHDLLEIADIGYDIRVLQANNGQVALDIMAEQTPDLIVSDVMMPRMGGYEFLQKVRENSDWIHIPFIFVTAKGEEPDIRKGKLSDADLYITKPFVITKLLELIHTQLDRAFERRQSRRENLESLKKEILQVLNHEFRTPLTYVTAYYEMLADSVTKYAGKHNYSEYLRGIQAGCIRLTKLIEDFIFVVELRSGEAQQIYAQNARPLDNLTSLIQGAIAAKQQEATENNVQIFFEPPDAVPTIFGHPESIQNSVERLLDNAIKFTDPGYRGGGSVEISIITVEDELHIAFQDEGIGVPQNMHNQIFELFVQHNRGLIEQQGAGVGLAVAKGLVELHQGHIELESQDSVGSRFTIILPIYKEKTNKQGTPNRLTEPKNATVLIVEDDEHLLVGLADLLAIFDGEYKLHVLTAENGVAGLAVLEKHLPDLIISDIMMPQMSGYEFLQAVRKNPKWLHIPFIFLTAKGEKRDEYEGLRLGVDEYITKPYDSDDMLRFVVKQLDKHFHSQSILAQSFDSLKRSIINLITPDFRVPLSSVNEYSAELSKSLHNVHTDEGLKRSLQGIHSNSVRLTTLIEDFISLAELHTGEAETVHRLRSQPIYELGMLLFETSQSYANQLNDRGVKIECELVQGVPVVFGNSSTLLDMVGRLIDLCLTHCHLTEGGSLVLSVHSTDQDEVALHIHFTGAIHEDFQTQFESILSMNEIDLSRLPKYAASIYIIKAHIELHNGRIELENNSTDGCTFTITLPQYMPPAEEETS